MNRDSDFTVTSSTPNKDVYGPVSAKLPWVLRERPKKKNPLSPEDSAAKSIRITSFTQNSFETSDESLRSLSIDEVSSPTEPNSSLQDHSPPNSERSSTPSTITPLTYKGTEDARMTIDAEIIKDTVVTMNTGSDGDDEKSPTFERVMQIPRKSVGSGSSKVLSKKDTPKAPESCASGGDSTLRGIFRNKKEGKAKDLVSDSAKGKAAEQDEESDNLVTLKVSSSYFLIFLLLLI